MKYRQIKKIIKEYGRWYPVGNDFIQYPSSMNVEYFRAKGLEHVPYKKLKKFYPFCEFRSFCKTPFIYGITL